MMKRINVLLFVFFLYSSLCLAQQSWKSPTYKAAEYRKVIVLAKTSDELARRQLEDATVQSLVEKGITAIPAYLNIEAPDLGSEEAFMKKADELQVDALLAYTFGKVKSEHKRTPSINARAGVSVKVGIFKGFLGSNVPIAGGTKKVETVAAKASFYTRASTTMQWSQPLSGKLNKGTGKLADDFANKTVKNMIKDSLF